MKREKLTVKISDDTILMGKYMFITTSAISKGSQIAQEALYDLFDRMRCEDFQQN